MPVGLAHVGRGVADSLYRFIDEAGEEVELRGVGGSFSGRLLRWRLRHEPGGQFVKADGDCLPEIHGGLFRAGGNREETMAEGEVAAGNTAFFGAEDESDAAPAREFMADGRGNFREFDDGLIRLAVGKAGRAEDESGAG